MLSNASTWRELLDRIVADSEERQRIIQELQITPLTLKRWLSGESKPRLASIHNLLTLLPQHEAQLEQLLRREGWFREAPDPPLDEPTCTISTDFYLNVLAAHSSENELSRFPVLSNLILQEALKQLDPTQQGQMLCIIRCMPPSGPEQKIRSLHEAYSIENEGWSEVPHQKAIFLGAESLTGNVVSHPRPFLMQNIAQIPNLLQTTRALGAGSIAIYPILSGGGIAGVFGVSSRQPYAFHSPVCTTLIERYASMLALAFEPEDFYPLDQIALGVMPFQSQQEYYKARARQLPVKALYGIVRKQIAQHKLRVDRLAWQKLEEELLTLPTKRAS